MFLKKEVAMDLLHATGMSVQIMMHIFRNILLILHIQGEDEDWRGVDSNGV